MSFWKKPSAPNYSEICDAIVGLKTVDAVKSLSITDPVIIKLHYTDTFSVAYYAANGVVFHAESEDNGISWFYESSTSIPFTRFLSSPLGLKELQGFNPHNLDTLTASFGEDIAHDVQSLMTHHSMTVIREYGQVEVVAATIEELPDYINPENYRLNIEFAKFKEMCQYLDSSLDSSLMVSKSSYLISTPPSLDIIYGLDQSEISLEDSVLLDYAYEALRGYSEYGENDNTLTIGDFIKRYSRFYYIPFFDQSLQSLQERGFIATAETVEEMYSVIYPPEDKGTLGQVDPVEGSVTLDDVEKNPVDTSNKPHVIPVVAATGLSREDFITCVMRSIDSVKDTDHDKDMLEKLNEYVDLEVQIKEVIDTWHGMREKYVDFTMKHNIEALADMLDSLDKENDLIIRANPDSSLNYVNNLWCNLYNIEEELDSLRLRSIESLRDLTSYIQLSHGATTPEALAESIYRREQLESIGYNSYVAYEKATEEELREAREALARWVEIMNNPNSYIDIPDLKDTPIYERLAREYNLI